MHDLLQLMYQDGHLSSTELAALKRTSRQLRENPVRVLRSLNVATPTEIKELLQRYYGFAAATDQLIEELDDSLRALIPADLALHYCVLPIADDNGQVYVLMEDPTDKGLISQLEFFLDKKIVPVIATVQQLSNGLCRLYGVEPGRLNLSSLLEASRGAVGVTANHLRGAQHFVDDTQPLLDDEVFSKLKVKPKKIVKKPPPPTTKVESNVPSSPAEIQAATPVQTPISPANSASATEPTTAPAVEAIDPALSAAVNLVGLRLSLARNRQEAAQMASEGLRDFGLSLQIKDSDSVLMTWKGQDFQVALTSEQTPAVIPANLKPLVKRIAQCRAE